MLFYTNLERRNAGLNELRMDEALALAARHHAREMVTLQYLSHESPMPENATLGRRVARAGSAVRYIAENIARVQNQAEAGREAVAGWMTSPGHRDNLMNPLYTHVGFGVAANTRGELYIVQVFAFQPLELTTGHVRQEVVDKRLAQVSFSLQGPFEVLLTYRSEILSPQVFAAGSHTLDFVYEGNDPVHLVMGVRAVAATGGFIAQDDGWFDPRTGIWDGAAHAPRQNLHITAVDSFPVQEQHHQVTLVLNRAPQERLAVWVNHEHQPNTHLAGTHLQFEVPTTLHEPVVAVGLQSPESNGQYRVVLELTLKKVGGAVVLAPVTAGE